MLDFVGKNVFHLSHNDLDGYGSQVVVNSVLDNVKFFNSGYGPSIKVELEKIFALSDSSEKKSIILITDLNLDMEIAIWLDGEVASRGGVELLLLDHHNNGKNVASEFNWYNLNDKYCATKLTYFYFKSMLRKNSLIKAFASIINNYDLWKEDNTNFYIGKCLNYALFNIGYAFPKELPEEKRNFILYFLPLVTSFLIKGVSVNKMEKELFSILKLGYIKDTIPEELFFNENILIDDKYNHYTYELLKDKLEVINIGGIRFLLFYAFDGNIFQNISHIFNSNRTNFDACISVSESGGISLRSKGKEDIYNVSKIAQTYFNGNGHFNASGGSICNYEKNKKYTYEEVKKILNSYN